MTSHLEQAARNQKIPSCTRNLSSLFSDMYICMISWISNEIQMETFNLFLNTGSWLKKVGPKMLQCAYAYLLYFLDDLLVFNETYLYHKLRENLDLIKITVIIRQCWCYHSRQLHLTCDNVSILSWRRPMTYEFSFFVHPIPVVMPYHFNKNKATVRLKWRHQWFVSSKELCFESHKAHTQNEPWEIKRSPRWRLDWQAKTWTWWRHQMELFPALLDICAGNSPVTGEFLAQRPVTRSFDVLFWSAPE